MKKQLSAGTVISLIFASSILLFESRAGDPVDAGPDQTLTFPVTSTTITAVVSGGQFGYSQWSVVGGDPMKVTIDSPNTLSTGVSFSAPGVYTLEIVIDVEGPSDTLTITVLGGSYRPDIRIGTRSTPGSHKGNNIYNQNGKGQRISLRTKNTRPVRFYFSVENDGSAADRISVRGAGISRSRFNVSYLDTTTRPVKNVTRQILVDRYVKNYAPGEIRKFTATISRRSNSAFRHRIKETPKFKASSNGAPRNLPDIAEGTLFFRR